jgi:hypothetical protein
MALQARMSSKIGLYGGYSTERIRLPIVDGPIPDSLKRRGLQACRRALAKYLQGAKKHVSRTVEGDTGSAGQFAQFLAIIMRGDRYVHVAGRVVSEQRLQPDLAWCGVHKIDAPDNLGDSLSVIVYNDRKVIGNQAITSQNYEITRL